MWCLQMSIPCGHGGPYMERGSLDKAWALGILGLPYLCASPGTRPHPLRASWCETRPTPQWGCEGDAMRTYVADPTMRPAACLVLNTCESFPGLLRELREMKKNAKGWKIATGSEICEGHYDSCLWDKTRTRGTSFGPAEFNFI